MCTSLDKLAEKGMTGEYIQMYNSAESKKLVECLSRVDWKLNPKWEFMVCSTPRNGLVKVKFVTIVV